MGLTVFSYAMAFVKDKNGLVAALIIGCVLLPLCFFKYFVFFANTSLQLMGSGRALSQQWRLPLGVSFVTFTVIAYLADVMKQKVKPEKDFFRYALYVSFFPHLIAGPIVRPRQLLPQLDKIQLRRGTIKLGALLFAVGYVKKVLFADQIAVIIDQIYHKTGGVNFLESLFALYGFPAQIYCDFSGYTDMALGCAFILGIRLPYNFKRPFIAHSIQNFWRRWHITLSTWLRDYLYKPLGGSRGSHGKTVRNLLMTMLLGGLWHGASWTFVLWGAFHGLFLAGEYVVRSVLRLKNRIPQWLCRLWTFHVVAALFILFRSRGIDQAVRLFQGFFAGAGESRIMSLALFPMALTVIFYLTHYWDRLSLVYVFSKRLPDAVIVTVVAVLVLIGTILSAGGSNAFIYFDF